MKIKKRIYSLALIIAVLYSVSLPANASDFALASNIEGNPKMATVLSNKHFMEELASEAPSSDLIDSANITRVEDNLIQFENNTLVASTVQGDVVIAKYQKKYAAILSVEDYTPSGSGSISRDTVDTSRTVHVYTTVDYSLVTDSVLEYAAVDKVTGYYTASGLNGTTLIKQELRIGQTGWTIGRFATQNEDYSIPVATTSWTKYPPSGWDPVCTTETNAIGATYTITMQRPSGSTWTVELENRL